MIRRITVALALFVAVTAAVHAPSATAAPPVRVVLEGKDPASTTSVIRLMGRE